MTRNIFLRKYLAYHMYKPMPMDEKISKNLKLDFSGPKGLLFCLKSTIVQWTGNELAGDDVTVKTLSWHLEISHILLILDQSALKYSWNNVRW